RERVRRRRGVARACEAHRAHAFVCGARVAVAKLGELEAVRLVRVAAALGVHRHVQAREQNLDGGPAAGAAQKLAQQLLDEERAVARDLRVEEDARRRREGLLETLKVRARVSARAFARLSTRANDTRVCK